MSSAGAYAVWAVLGAALLALVARAHRPGGPGPAPARPAALVQRLATGPVLRVLLVLAWMWLGWHLFAR